MQLMHPAVIIAAVGGLIIAAAQETTQKSDLVTCRASNDQLAKSVEDLKLQIKVERARREQAEAQAGAFMQQAVASEKQNSFRSALGEWEKVCAARSDEANDYRIEMKTLECVPRPRPPQTGAIRTK